LVQLQETTKFAVSPPFSQLLMPFLPQMSRSYVVFGKAITLPFTTYIFIQPLEDGGEFRNPFFCRFQLFLLCGVAAFAPVLGLVGQQLHKPGFVPGGVAGDFP
jgi:hypothetical protein